MVWVSMMMILILNLEEWVLHPNFQKKHYAKRICCNIESVSKTIPCFFFQVMDWTCLLLGSDYSFPNRLGFASSRVAGTGQVHQIGSLFVT